MIGLDKIADFQPSLSISGNQAIMSSVRKVAHVSLEKHSEKISHLHHYFSLPPLTPPSRNYLSLQENKTKQTNIETTLDFK